jgi:ATP-dependent DNA ligase
MKTRSDVSLPNFLEPMQAKLVDSMRPGDWIYEIKFDGYRALALRGGNETRILSRNQKDLGKKFPTIAESIAKLGVLPRPWNSIGGCRASRQVNLRRLKRDSCMGVS